MIIKSQTAGVLRGWFVFLNYQGDLSIQMTKSHMMRSHDVVLQTKKRNFSEPSGLQTIRNSDDDFLAKENTFDKLPTPHSTLFPVECLVFPPSGCH